MNYNIITLDNGVVVVRMEDKSIILSDEQSALDIFMSIAYETGENRLIIDKDNLTEDFFDLSNKIAGSIL